MTHMMHDDVSILSTPAMGRAFPQMAAHAVLQDMPLSPVHGQRMLNISALCVDRHLGDHADGPGSIH